MSVFPDPDAEGFDAERLPSGITPEALRAARERTRRIFHPDVGNKEGLSRKSLRTLLPESDGPVLQGRHQLRIGKQLRQLRFGGDDVVRHKLVQRIVEAYRTHAEETGTGRSR